MKMSEELKLVNIVRLVPYERNARTHSAEQIEKLRASIREFGFVNPVLIDGEYNVIAGHGRIEAARAEGITEVPCVFVNHLTETQRRAYILADNRLAELAGWDSEILEIEIEELKASDYNIELTGFSENDEDYGEIARPDVIEDEYTFEEKPDSEIKAKKGDLYKLGEHLLLCGDSTKQSDWERIMGGSVANLVVTDPPYNMGYEGGGGTCKEKRIKNKIHNDNLPEEEFKTFLINIYKNIEMFLARGGSFYIFYKELGGGVFLTSLRETGLTFKQELIWAKNQIVLGGAKYQNIYEPIVFGCNGEQVASWHGKRKQKSVIESTDYMSESELIETIKELLSWYDVDIIREKKNTVNDLHPTMKPVRLLGKLIANSSLPGDVVVDCFGGSGSTMIACEQLKRKCYMIEYEEKYIDTIIDRWESHTGEKSKLIESLR